jgi:hypothetical protein
MARITLLVFAIALGGCASIQPRPGGAALPIGPLELGGQPAAPYSMPRPGLDPLNQGENYLAFRF